MIQLSPGLLTGSFELLRLARLTQLLLTEIPGSFSKLGGMATNEVLNVVQTLNWIEATSSGVVELTIAGQRVADLADHRTRMRTAILDYIEVVRPSWLQFAPFGRSRVVSFAGSTVEQVLDEAGLVFGTDEATVAFWDALAARARGLRDHRLTAIGRLGERASLEYEQSRTGLEPKWVALENNADGYDLLSVVDGSNHRSLSVEVKTTSLESGGFFHITRNEWNWATSCNDHVFHLWRTKDIPAAKPTFVVSASSMRVHVPLEQGIGTWESVMIPFDAFCAGALF